MTKKKARYHGCPVCLKDRTQAFVADRDRMLEEGKVFVSVDETSFGRHGRPICGYAPKGHPLFVQSNKTRITTMSVLATVIKDGTIQTSSIKQGSFIGGFTTI
jgi:hypothetical protein